MSDPLPPPTPPPPPRGTSFGLWIFTGLPALALLTAGAMKLGGSSEVAANFARWGYPPWFVNVTGVIEVGGAVCLFVPRVAPFAAALLCCTMIGAGVTHLTHGEANHLAAPIVLLLWVAAVGWARRAPLVTLFRRS